MIESVRRISTTLFVLGMLILGITTLAQFVVQCPTESNCLGAVFSLYTEDVEYVSVGKSTSAYVPSVGISHLALIHQLLQQVGIYLLILSAIVLIALEMRELHYLKQLARKS